MTIIFQIRRWSDESIKPPGASLLLNFICTKLQVKFDGSCLNLRSFNIGKYCVLGNS